jgi:hypothetical protein
MWPIWVVTVKPSLRCSLRSIVLLPKLLWGLTSIADTVIEKGKPMGQRFQLGFIAAFICLLPFAAHAQQSAPVSKCLAVADANPYIAPRIILASAVSLPLAQVQIKAPEVSFSFIDHAVWQISSPNGVTAVTDYYGLPITPP